MAMNPGMKMLMMAKSGQNGKMRGGESGSQMGGYNREMNDRPEMRRRRDERGRFMENGRMEGGQMEAGAYARMENESQMQQDPFGRMKSNAAREMNREPKEPHDPKNNPYGDDDPYDDNRMRRNIYGGEINYERPEGGRGNISYFRAKPQEDREKMMGFRQQGREEKDEGFDKQTAMEWVESMEDKEGVKGGMYTWHQAQQYGRNMGITGEQRLVEFFAAMNAMYSEYHAVGKKFGVDRPEFYAHLAKCFIEDPDAVEDKIAKYWQHVVRHE